MNINEIRIRDPFILPVRDEGQYYLFGTTTLRDEGYSTEPRLDFYRSQDLVQWDGPFTAFEPDDSFWSRDEYWAPEVHYYRDRYYMFATFNGPERCRGTQALISDKPGGPYRPVSEGPLTPADWMCLDGTLYLTPAGEPWLVFCHEWAQIGDGEICAAPLAADLTSLQGDPVTLFKASAATWSRPFEFENRPESAYVTDGPFFWRTRTDALLMLWSTFDAQGYVQAVARSLSGELAGPWIQTKTPWLARDCGHGMLFETFEGQLMLVIHQPNEAPYERACFLPVCEHDQSLELV